MVEKHVSTTCILLGEKSMIKNKLRGDNPTFYQMILCPKIEKNPKFTG